MKLEVSKKPSIREKDTIEIDIKTTKPLWRDNLKYLIIDSFIRCGFIPETIYCNSLGFIGFKRGVPFCKEKLDEVFNSYCGPRKVSVDGIESDVFVNELVFFFAKKPLKFYFTIGFGGGRANYGHNSVSLSLETFNSDKLQKNVRNLFTEMCLLLATDFARLQFYTAQENYNHKRSIGTDIVLSDLMSGLPDVYAITVFGKPYLDFFGREKVLTSPCAKVEEVSTDLIWMQLTDYLFDERGSKESLLNIREAVKAHLNNNAFYDILAPWEHQYGVPQFDLSEIRKPIELSGHTGGK